MATAGNETVVGRYLEEIINQGDLAAADELLTPTFTIDHAGVPEVLRGPAAFKAFIAAFRTAFPDVHVMVETVVADGEAAAVAWAAEGTHLGPFDGVPATGRRATWEGIAIVRVGCGQIVEVWSATDGLGLRRQLGIVTDAVPVAAATPAP